MLRDERFHRRNPEKSVRVNWFNISLQFCRRAGKENLLTLIPGCFVIKKDANDSEDVEISISEKTKHHQSSLGDKGDWNIKLSCKMFQRRF